MPCSLSEFVEGLASAGELHRVPAEVDVDLEIAEITRRVAQANGAALVFNRVRGRLASVAINMLSTPQRACRALGVTDLKELEDRLGALVVGGNRGWLDRLRLGQGDADRYRPKSIKTAPCQQVLRLGRDIDLAQWPSIRSWPQESHESFTAALVVTADSETSRHAVEAHIVVRLDATRLAIVDESFSQLDERLRPREKTEKLPVAIVLGGDPAQLVAAWLPKPSEQDSYHLVGMLRGAALEVVRGRTVPFDVPSDAEVIIEGEIDRTEPTVALEIASWASGHCRHAEGVVVQVTAMTHRTKPIIPQIVAGTDSREIETLQLIRAHLVGSGWKGALPELVDLALPSWGGLHAYAIVSIRKQHAHQARKVASALWGDTTTMFTKCLIIVDESVDVRSATAVMSAVGANVHPARDVFFQTLAGNLADHAQPPSNAGSGMAIDATTKLAGEHSGQWPTRLNADSATQNLIAERLSEYGLDFMTPDS